MDLAVDLPLIILLVVLFGFSVFISAVETAFLRIPAVRVHTLAEEGSRSARKLAQLTENLSEVLNAILLAALLSQIGAATVAGILASRYWEAVGVTIASAVLTFLLYIYAEAIPKTYAVRHPDRVAITLAYPLAVVVTLLRPLVKVLVWIADIQMPGKGVVTSPTITENELRMLASRAATEGEITSDDLELIERAFRIGDRQVDDIMVPRPDIVAVDGNSSVAFALQAALAAGHRRVPIFEGTIDNITGVVKLHNLIQVPEDRRDELPVSRLSESVLVVPESKRVLGLLNEMQSAGTHLAVVVDEYGSTAGLVTIEDIAEEVLGSISEGPDDSDVVHVGEDEWLIDASLPVEDLSQILDEDLDDTDWNTAAGLVLSLLGRLPKVGDEVTYGHHTLRVVSVRGRRITRIQVRRLRKK
ncbi:MAG: hemolysin family protein [Actinomycetota bacterium]|nr:hemolysin family protein [Actinomycetota bacterium]